MIEYQTKIRELRFNFRPEEVIDYQTLFSLIGSLLTNKKEYETNKEELFHTVQILVLVYGLEDQLDQSNFTFNPNNIDVNDLNLWKYLLVALYNDFLSSPKNEFNVSDSMENTIISVLNILNNETFGENLELEEENKVKEEKEEDNSLELYNTYFKPKEECFEPEEDEEPYDFVEPSPNFNFINEDFTKEENCYNNDINFSCDEDLNNFNFDYLRDYIIKNDLLPYRCDNCGLSEWQGKILPLKLVHKDPNCLQQTLDNLKFLCPNCNSQIGKE